MFSAPHNKPAADHALLNTHSAEGRLGKPNFIHFPSQPSRSTKLFKRGGVNSRFHHTATVIGTNVFMIGGQSSLSNSTALPTTLLVMDSSTLAVNEQNLTRVSVAGHGAVPIGGEKVLILFGEKSVTPLMLADPVQQIDVQTGALNTLNFKGTAPSARYAHTAALVNNKVYVIGGMNASNVLGDVSYIDLSSNSWNIINNISRRPIAGHSTAVIDNYLITCFGFDDKFELLSDCVIFDTINNVYVKSVISGNPPTPRSYSSMVTGEGENKILYIFGGLNKSNQGNNDLYTLDATKLPSLTWSPVSISAKSNQNLIPSPRGAHSAVMRSDIMIVWGGHSDTNLSDAGSYFFDANANAWVDAKTASTKFTSIGKNSTPQHLPWGIFIGAIIAGIIIIMGIIGFFIIRRRRLKQILVDSEIQFDPYIRPGGQLGSDPDLPTNEEDKKIQAEGVPVIEPTTSESVTPPTSLTQPQSPDEKEPKQSSGSIVSTNLKFSSDNPLLTRQIKHTSTESQRTKRTHKRTSSVSLTPADLANITRPCSSVYHKSSLSASSIGNSTNRSSFLSSTFDSTTPYRNSQSTSVTSLDSPTFEKNNKYDSRATSKSVYSMQWVGFDNNMIEGQLMVRNGACRKSTGSVDDGYVIHGDYIDTTDRRSYGGDFTDHEDLPKRRRTLPIRNCINAIPEKEDVAEEVKSRDVNGGESDIVNKHAYHTYPSQNPDEEDERSSRKSKRSSKRTSRVSFALKNEKIEFDETESSKSVSLARISGRTSSSESSSGTPSIIEEEEDINEFPNLITPKTSALTLKTLRLYDNGEDEFNPTGTHLSRFSLSMFDISKEQSTSNDKVSEIPEPPVAERTKSSEIRNSIKELMMDQGVLWAIQDAE